LSIRYPTNEEDHELVRNSSSPSEAKQLGRYIKLRKDWDLIKDRIMEKGIRAKFEQNRGLKKEFFEVKIKSHTDKWSDNSDVIS
jgi:predicted NAD-dependent protein-ADP-ribosyltransferase YbiA (DUF1768 family)